MRMTDGVFLSFLTFSPASNPCLRMSCDFMCLLNPVGAKCICPEGKVLLNGSCSDVNISGRLTPFTQRLTYGGLFYDPVLFMRIGALLTLNTNENTHCQNKSSQFQGLEYSIVRILCRLEVEHGFPPRTVHASIKCSLWKFSFQLWRERETIFNPLEKSRFTPQTLPLSYICRIAQFDAIDCYVVRHSQRLGLGCFVGELCHPPCENGGRCLANEKGEWRCYCWPDFSGERCEVNHCTDYCLNGGTCVGSPLGKSTSLHHTASLRRQNTACVMTVACVIVTEMGKYAHQCLVVELYLIVWNVFKMCSQNNIWMWDLYFGSVSQTVGKHSVLWFVIWSVLHSSRVIFKIRLFFISEPCLHTKN